MRLLHCLHAPFLLTLLGSAACAEAPLPDAPPPVDYHHDAVALLDRYCTGCHSPGGVAPMALTDYGTVKSYAASIKAAVQGGQMPPWMPSDSGLPLRYSRAMRAEDRDLLVRWIDSGTPEGDPARLPRTDLPPAEQVVAPRADLVLDPGAVYQPDNTRSDDYHCFVLDPKLAADTFLQAATVVPGNRAIVHHVLMFEILAGEAAAIQQKNVDGKGYTCFGGPGGGERPTTLFGWVPGSVPLRVPEGTALRIHKGSLLVMQVHYNTLASKGAGDRSVAQLELSATPPVTELHVVPIANPKQLKIAAGDPHAKQQIAFPVSLVESIFQLPVGDLMVYSAAPHMHLLGTRIAIAIADQPVVEIPRWDFHWQQSYTLSAPLLAHKNDTITLECDYDNSQSHQPLVGGVQQTPRDVTWGEGTLDEMCLNFLSVTVVP